MKNIAAAAILLLIAITATAQEENSKSVSIRPDYSMLWAGIETSQVPYFNTKTLESNGAQLYLAPYINYNHKSGLGIKLKTYALPGGSDPGFFMSSVMPYYATYNGAIYPFISYTRFLMHENPSIPFSPIRNELYGHIRIRTKWVDPWIGVDYGFGRDDSQDGKVADDLNTFVALSHLFNKSFAAGEQALGIRPMIQLNAGTDRYFRFLRTTRYIYQSTNGSQAGYGRKGPGGGMGSENEVTYMVSETNEFGFSNFEVNLSLMYFIGQLSIEPSGTVFFPLRGDDRSSYGLWQINLNYWFHK